MVAAWQCCSCQRKLLAALTILSASSVAAIFPFLSGSSAASLPAADELPQFPSNNSLVNGTGNTLQDLLTSLRPGAAPRNGSNITDAVVFFWLDSCPNSLAMRAVVECLPAFFSSTVPFLAVELSDLPIVAVLSHSLHALPVLQVHSRGKKYRYKGLHQLEPLLKFVSKALGHEPLASLEAAATCGGSNSSCGGWTCPRWDGEVTAEELAALRANRPDTDLLALSLAFLACRVAWWLWQRPLSRQGRRVARFLRKWSRNGRRAAAARVQQQQQLQQQLEGLVAPVAGVPSAAPHSDVGTGPAMPHAHED